MMLYVKAYSSYKSDEESIVVKKELKEVYKLDTRRQDAFMHLAILGAQRLRQNIEISESDELYITSGLGNVDILEKAYDYVYDKGGVLTPFDFINMLGNTTSYYVALSLGIKGKNIFEISDEFSIRNVLISIYASLHVGRNDAILGAVDLVNKSDEVMKRVLGIEKELSLISSVNYQKLSINPENTLAEIEFSKKLYLKEELDEILKDEEYEICESIRCRKKSEKAKRSFFQTELSYVINLAIKEKKNILHVECLNERYNLTKIRVK